MNKPLRKTCESIVYAALAVCALLSIAVTAGIIWVLVSEATTFFAEVPILKFLLGTVWTPLLEPRHFGVLPLVCGTMLVAVGALLLATPIGLCAAIYLSEYAPGWVRQIAKPILELLAGVPTVVFGYFALTFVTPYLIRPLFPSAGFFNAAAGIIVVAIMIIPTICSLCEDALRAVPKTLREAGYALSATKLEVSLRIVLPAALSGVVASCLLALARAIGETMAVTLAAGMTPKMTLNPLESVQTMTSYIVQIAKGDAPLGSLEYRSIFAVGLGLFAITLCVNMLAQRILGRFREAYE